MNRMQFAPCPNDYRTEKMPSVDVGLMVHSAYAAAPAIRIYDANIEILISGPRVHLLKK
jgi:hypothetical protein